MKYSVRSQKINDHASCTRNFKVIIINVHKYYFLMISNVIIIIITIIIIIVLLWTVSYSTLFNNNVYVSDYIIVVRTMYWILTPLYTSRCNLFADILALILSTGAC